MRQITVTYSVNAEQEKKLEGLLPFWKEYVLDGNKCCADWTIDDVFRAVMTMGCKWDIDRRLEAEQNRQESRKEISERRAE